MKRHLRRFTTAAAVTTVAAVAATAVSVGAAAAASTARNTVTPNTYGTFNNSVWTNGVNIHSGPGTGYTAVGQAQTHQTLVDSCYTTGTVIHGNPFWDKIHDDATGINGYVTEYYLNNKSPTKHC